MGPVRGPASQRGEIEAERGEKMRRRRFLRALGTAAAAAGAGQVLGCGVDGEQPSDHPSLGGATSTGGDQTGGPGSAPADTPSLWTATEPGFQRWTWVHGNADRTHSEWEARFGELAAAGFTGVLVGGDPAGVVAEAAHKNGLEFHRWVWTLNRNGDAWVKENHPDWFTVSRKGESSLEVPPYVGYYRWLCPTKPRVREYLKETMVAIAQAEGVDGIHLDYVRHCDVILPRGLWSTYDLIQDRELPEFDYCYCESCGEAFGSLTGRDPLEMEDPSADEEWRRFRWDSVTGLVRVLAEAVHGVEKPISAAVFPTPTIARRLVRQAWDEWPLDAFFPMLYHEFYEEGLDWIGRGVREGLAALGRDSDATPIPRLYAGLYLPTLNRDGNRDSAEEVARGTGADGVSFFEMNGLDLGS